MLTWLLLKFGIISQVSYGVYWDCADCGCLMHTDDEAYSKSIFCGSCLEEKFATTEIKGI